MTFEEWWNGLQDEDWKRTLLPGEEGKQRPTNWGESFKRHAKEAWQAATLAEREACAKLCEDEICSCCWGEAAQDAAEHLAAAIRARTE